MHIDRKTIDGLTHDSIYVMASIFTVVLMPA